MRVDEFKTKFVHYIPEQIEEGVLYISEEYGSAVHLCACGCGHKAGIPIKPFWESGWSYTREGDVVTLAPSLLHRFECQSHYFIEQNKVRWA